MKKIGIILTWVTALTAPASANAEQVTADSISEDRVYELMLSDYPEACRIMNVLRQKGGVPAYRLDITEGDLHFNNGKYYPALLCYNRAMASPEVGRNDSLQMAQLHRLISAYDCVHNDTEKMRCIKHLINKAINHKNLKLETNDHNKKKKPDYLQDQRAEGIRMMQEATDLMETCDYKYKYDNLCYNYNTLILYALRDERYPDALQMLEKAESLETPDAGDDHEMEGGDSRQQTILLAYRTVILHHLGHTSEAESAYRHFLSVEPTNHRHDYLIVPYLTARGRHAEVIAMHRSREAAYIANSDTANYHMLTIKRTLGNAYSAIHRHDSAAIYYKELAHLTDLLKKQEQQSAALELATLHKTTEQESRLQQQAAHLERNRLLMAFLALLMAVAVGVALYIFRTFRRIRTKNALIVKESTELMEFRDKFNALRSEYIALQDKMAEETAGAARGPEPSSLPEEAPAKEDGSVATTGCVSELTPEELVFWERIQNDIITEELFLDPNFTRETLIRRYGISKNRLARIFRHNTNEGLTHYIRNLRLEHAVKLMMQKPNFSIKAIAAECGINSTSTFYRIFTERFGMSPAEYQKNLFVEMGQERTKEK